MKLNIILLLLSMSGSGYLQMAAGLILAVRATVWLLGKAAEA